MRSNREWIFLVVVLVAVLAGTKGAGQTSVDVQGHVTAARTAAGQLWPSLVSNLCDAAEQSLKPAGSPPLPPAPQASRREDRADWFRGDPVKVFDNLYVFSTKGGRWGGTTIWAIKTSEGIINIDALYDYAIKDEMDAGMRKVGLDPAQIKVAFITHGHGDHFGGAKFLQELYGTRIYISEADWDIMVEGAKTPGGNQGMPLPKKDLTATDGQKYTLGDTTIQIYITPGHTPGTLSLIFPVKINGVTHMAALWGGTAISPTSSPDNLRKYSESVVRFMEMVKQQKVDIILSNHEAFGQYFRTINAMRANPKAPNPFVIGTDGVLRFLQVLDHCAKANSAAAALAKK